MSHNRFKMGQKDKISLKPLLSVGLFAVIIFFFVAGFGSISESTRERQRESLDNALTRNIVHYYSLEGKYPDSLEVLHKQYGLTYNQELFYVDYRFLGDNIYPDVTIIEEEQ
ncbi:MAG: hypothetical protein IJW63_09320 [Lachnospiraceae bacterium]|nr:hypothetical protein [Lachnospiraceae bacterium]